MFHVGLFLTMGRACVCRPRLATDLAFSLAWTQRGGGDRRHTPRCVMLDKGAANTFNTKERVYSRAIAFSHRRCSVPLESTLPNISAMYIWLIYMYIA